MFLKLLTAEMQYQDPLEPTDNSQYVTQLASFTQIETLQTVKSSMESLQANSMVGKVVSLTSDGKTVEDPYNYGNLNDRRVIYGKYIVVRFIFTEHNFKLENIEIDTNSYE